MRAFDFHDFQVPYGLESEDVVHTTSIAGSECQVLCHGIYGTSAAVYIIMGDPLRAVPSCSG